MKIQKIRDIAHNQGLESGKAEKVELIKGDSAHRRQFRLFRHSTPETGGIGKIKEVPCF